MIVLFIIGYLFIGVCVAIGLVLFNYHLDDGRDIEMYLNHNCDLLWFSSLFGLCWPISLFIGLIVGLIPFIFKKLIIVIAKRFVDAKKD